MNLVKKLKFFHLLCLLKVNREIVFSDVVDTKEAFKDYINICLWFSSKICDFFNFDFYAK